VTELTAWDVPVLAPLYAEIFNAPPWNDRWSVRSAEDRLRAIEGTPGFAGAMLTTGGTVLGFIGGYRQRWWDDTDHFCIAELAVREQGRGHGRTLLTRFLADLPGVSQVYLMTALDLPAAGFYRHLGFTNAEHQGVMVRRLTA
jgi:aminoglycoside 6'-N-acetyltransferase I